MRPADGRLAERQATCNLEGRLVIPWCARLASVRSPSWALTEWPTVKEAAAAISNDFRHLIHVVEAAAAVSTDFPHLIDVIFGSEPRKQTLMI
jgi:hypothetical protein